MKFCTKCDNMYYIGVDEKDNNKLTHYCRSCGHVDESLTEGGVCVLDTKFTQSDQKSDHLINKYTKLDPTLPRIHNVRCPSAKCKTNLPDAKEPAEIIYMRYDNTNLKYVYMCASCDTTWQSKN
jgi:hypothetical protein